MMQRHDAVFLEEPPTDGFETMLDNILSVDDYLLAMDIEYPEFSRRMCHLQQKLHAGGIAVFQVEPFIEELLGIHDLFGRGYGPKDLKPGTRQYRVYLAERNATGALLNYYKTVMTGSFEATIEAIRHFARADAARFRLRDRLRAEALIHRLGNYASVYIEAGVIHYQLWQLLFRRLPRAVRVRPVFLADIAFKQMKQKRLLYGPGDQLTLWYIFHPTLSQKRREALLAARAVIYSKIITKEEMYDTSSPFPHLEDEASCIRITRTLSMTDCQRLFPLIRHAKTADARRKVAEYRNSSM
ncbi:MAG: hypothetical protein GY737_02755 [Desulfobacteraceae bacterium]|nr:hypothetical protein [Desulfobacteraceae bacterium]